MGNLGWLGWLIVGLTLIAASFLSWRRGHGQLIQLIQYRVLWSELIGGRTVQFSGKVTAAFEIAWREAQAKRSSHNYHGVMVEARRQSSDPWPRPWDEIPPAP